MARSLQAFYTRHGLAGQRLGNYAANLQATALRLKAQGLAPCEIKRALAAEQAPLLRFSKPFKLWGQADFNFLTRDNWDSVFEKRSLSPSKAAFARSEQQKGLALILDGRVGFQEHYGGQGERLKIKKAKYLTNPNDLLQAYQEAGLFRTFASLADWTIGERTFINKSFELFSHCLAQGRNVAEAKAVLASIKFKMVLSQNAGGEIVENLVKNNFFGFQPANFIFMFQPRHPTYGVTADGELEADPRYPTQGNHGLTTFHSLLENQWFRVVAEEAPGGFREERLTTEDYRAFQRGLTMLMYESVEDLTQYEKPFDYGFINRVARQGREFGQLFFQQIVRQKTENPQPGGVFVHLFDKRQRLNRQAVIESNRTGLKPEEIPVLNRGWGAIFDPNEFDRQVVNSPMLSDLHPTFKPKGDEPVVRIESEIPFGDANLYLDSAYYVINPRIANLKVPGDIPAALRTLRQMELKPGLVDFARDFLGLERSR
ncbi:MAG: hypothetical protein WCW67_06765 [Candidatus Margulisiibacteriota bacterium]|jgi:hypothetical protein